MEALEVTAMERGHVGEVDGGGGGGGTEPASSENGRSESGEILLLPVDTRVRVVGNKRTRRSLIGQEGLVRKSVGLGGWHWLKMDSGEVVKLQRNALHVVSLSTGERLAESDLNADGGGLIRSGPGMKRSRVRLDKLSSDTLWRYLKASKVPAAPGVSRATLVAAVQRHFEERFLPVDEMTVGANLARKRRRYCSPKDETQRTIEGRL